MTLQFKGEDGILYRVKVSELDGEVPEAEGSRYSESECRWEPVPLREVPDGWLTLFMRHREPSENPSNVGRGAIL